MKGRDALREMIAAGKPTEQPAVAPAAFRSSGAVKAMSVGLQRLSDEASEAKNLRATLAAGQHVLEINPADVEVSFVSDRMPLEADEGFLSLKENMSRHGQQVPILVRPHPDDPRRYQAAYGHRRLRAAAELATPVKAIVRNLTDAELVVAQGQENNERRDLSFIERALFASHLDTRGFDRDVITSALGVDKPELSRLLSVVSSVDEDIIAKIGPAPKVGRPRWLAFAARMTDAKARKHVKQITSSESFKRCESSARFNLLFADLGSEPNQPAGSKQKIATVAGEQIGWMSRDKRGLRLQCENKAFCSFLEEHLPELLQQFEQRSALRPTGQKEEETADHD